MASFLPIFLVFCLDSFTMMINGEPTNVIKLRTQRMQGEILTTVRKNISYSSFKGIPYGETERRFEVGHLPKYSSVVVNATSKGPDCFQLDPLNNDEVIGSEDCLYLNIFTPVTDLPNVPDQLKAVMVWIHGGGFTRGSGDPNFYGPDFLIENDVIVVTFNYRLGPLGFLALKSKNHEANGNAGLKDQILALVWVHLHIIKFGGDPARVTIFGQGAGGASAFYHALSPMSHELFNGIISMSGTPMNPWAFQRASDAKKQAIELGLELGANTDDMDKLLDYLNNVPAEELLRNSSSIFPRFMPVLEDEDVDEHLIPVITTCVVDLFESGAFKSVPYMLGFMKDETLAFTGSEKMISELVSFDETVIENFNLTSVIPSVSANLSENGLADMVRQTTDLLYIATMERTKDYLLSSENLDKPVYYYEISVAPSQNSLHARYLNINSSGAADGDDLAYIWWISDAGMSLDPTDEVSIIREKMTRMFTNFAKYGNPTPDGTDDELLNLTWPDYRSTSLHLNINKEMTVEPYVNEEVDKIMEAAAPYLRYYKDCS